MDDQPRALNIPPGRVAQRLRIFQNEPKDHTTSSHTTTTPAASTTGKPIASKSKFVADKTEAPESNETTETAAKPSLSIVEADPEIASEHESEERGRSLQRRPSAGRSSQDNERVGEVLEVVRERLYSVQDIVRRERSGSSQARDDVMDELGIMLDNAIATTMIPRQSPHIPARASSSRPAPAKITAPHTALSRSQSLKTRLPDILKLEPKSGLENTSSTKPSSTPRASGALDTVPHRTFKNDLGKSRQRQVSVPVTFSHRPTGFPLSSPVRERALLWESMSRDTILEVDTPRVSPNTTRFHPVSLNPEVQEQPETAIPPIPLALPQLLAAEKEEERARILEGITPEPKEDLEKPVPMPEPIQRSTSAGWPGLLRFSEVGRGTSTVQQSASTACMVAEPDEHHMKHRPSLVKSTIRDLLIATKRKVSGKSQQRTESKEEHPTVRESELRASVADYESLGERHLPQLQATPGEVAALVSTDGANSRKAPSTSSTLDYKFTNPADERPSVSPVKPVIAAPVRGRIRESHSPRGRPYSIDQRFRLSPSRSNSRGSRGSFTFNIKARVSPGRGLGKDDTELFVTANIDSDASDEGY